MTKSKIMEINPEENPELMMKNNNLMKISLKCQRVFRKITFDEDKEGEKGQS